MDILEKVRHWSASAPEHPAHISDRSLLTYRELETNSETLAAYLTALQPDNHLPVVVIGHKEPEMLVAFLAAVKSGHPYIPVDVSTPNQRIEKIIEISQAFICLTPLKVKELLAESTGPKLVSSARNIAPEDPWYIIYTSGSTGEPKGVVITTGCLESFVEWMLNEQLPRAGQEIFLNQAPFPLTSRSWIYI